MNTEKEKMLSGELYNAEVPELVKERMECKQLCLELNNTAFTNPDKQAEITKKLLGKTGERFAVVPPFWCDYGYNIEIGNNFFSNHNLTILDAAKVTIGENVLIGPDCCISTSGHPKETELRINLLEFAHPITIGDNVWIGAKVTILPGVNIGNNCIIGAGSVVTKDIPDNSVAVGVPAKVIGESKR